jgi:hypothetical protein
MISCNKQKLQITYDNLIRFIIYLKYVSNLKLKQHKSDQYNSVMKESNLLKKEGLSKFAKKKFK